MWSSRQKALLAVSIGEPVQSAGIVYVCGM
jgi:hypothetical protein